MLNEHGAKAPRPGLANARAWRWSALALVTAGALGACDVLDVENPNSLLADDLENPAAGTSLANGAEATLARGLGYYVVPALTASDELEWIGSRDAWGEMNRGNVNNPFNEFTDFAFNWLGEGRWMADEAIRILSLQDSEGTIVDRLDLARALYFGGVAYTYVGDWLDDFAFSDRSQSSPPLGQDNMDQVFDQALDYLDRSLAVAESEGANGLATQIMAQRARTKHGKAVWQMLNPAGSVPSDPLVGPSSGAEADAITALQGVGASVAIPRDVRWELAYSAQTVWMDLGWQVNQRLEHRFGDRYIVPTADNKRRDETLLADPIDGVPDPAADAIMDRVEAGGQYPNLTLTSTREMLLIIAESRLADGDEAGAVLALNALRSLDGLTPYDPAVHEITAQELLVYARQANLYLTGRRLNDIYRFGETSDNWDDASIAVQVPGTIFPISAGERQSNTCIIDPGSCP
jgi:hypothetical protein